MNDKRITKAVQRDLRKMVTDLQWYVDERLDLSESEQRRTDSLARKALRLIGERATIEGVRAAVESLLEWVRQLV